MARLHHEDNEVLMPVSTTFATIISRSTIQAIGGIIVARLVTEWKVSAAVGSLYSILYIYEWFTWTNKAKGKRFKSQYVDYAGSELRQIVGMKSDTFSHQVNRELTSTFDRLSDYVLQSKLNYKDEILNLDKKIQRLEDTSKKAESFRNKADMFDKELTSFIKEFLQK
ncbi:mitofusin [Mytilus galloprovincialis]|uniref:Mitofusin n=1 Tax=Mytilus galloprovincialis TaxID=29158 RepID=A0A8B6GIN6_MYTGA|nr:mitofusin [Mytilus galloprovincialis]